MKKLKRNSRGIEYSIYFHVGVGDVVKTYFWHRSKEEDKIKTIRVTKVEDRRFGKVNNGTTQRSPLIRGINVNTEEKDHFDASFITEIVSRAKHVHRRKENIYKEEVEKPYFIKKGIIPLNFGWQNGPYSTIPMILAELNMKIETSFSHSRFKALWEKNKKPGLCVEGIKYKPFKKFVQRNVSKILVPAKLEDARKTHGIKQQENDYWKHVENEYYN